MVIAYTGAAQRAQKAYDDSMRESKDGAATFVRHGLIMLREETPQELNSTYFPQIMEPEKVSVDQTLTGPTFYRLVDGKMEYQRVKYKKQGSFVVTGSPEIGTMEIEDVPYEDMDGHELFSLAKTVERALKKYELI